MAIPEVLQILEKIKSIHEKKNSDYSQSGTPFQNFERSAMLGRWFTREEDKPYAVLIGVKLARIAVLREKQAKPYNESIEDSFLDLATYCILWYASYIEAQGRVKTEP